MNTPQYQFNLGNQDPLLQPVPVNEDVYTQSIEREIARLNRIKQQFNVNTQQVAKENIWDSIDKEINSMTNEQKQVLAKDDIYLSIDRELQLMIQQELINSVKDKISNSQKGKELLEKQLDNIKRKKKDIIDEANKEIAIFKKFQQAVQANPNLTYAEFIKSIK